MPTKVILLDIEGTVTPVDFVHRVLFPYSLTHLHRFVERHRNEPEVIQCLLEVQRINESSADALRSEGAIPSPSPAPGVEAILEQWIKEDKKLTPLKTLQGLIWKEGFQQGEFKAPLYPDVVPQLKAWLAEGLKISIYSSGSVFAQKLLFSHTTEGDITPFLSAYFDTNTGAKREPASYERIARELGVSPKEIHFFSDVVEELDAAAAAGSLTTLISRKHPVSTSLVKF